MRFTSCKSHSALLRSASGSRPTTRRNERYARSFHTVDTRKRSSYGYHRQANRRAWLAQLGRLGGNGRPYHRYGRHQSPAAKRRQQPKRTPSHDQLRGGNHQHSSSPRNRIRPQISIRDRTPWLTVLSPLRGYRGLTLRSPWADAQCHLLWIFQRL